MCYLCRHSYCDTDSSSWNVVTAGNIFHPPSFFFFFSFYHQSSFIQHLSGVWIIMPMSIIPHVPIHAIMPWTSHLTSRTSLFFSFIYFSRPVPLKPAPGFARRFASAYHLHVRYVCAATRRYRTYEAQALPLRTGLDDVLIIFHFLKFLFVLRSVCLDLW